MYQAPEVQKGGNIYFSINLRKRSKNVQKRSFGLRTTFRQSSVLKLLRMQKGFRKEEKVAQYIKRCVKDAEKLVDSNF